VERASVNLATNTATVEFDARVRRRRFRQRIETWLWRARDRTAARRGEKLYRARLIVAILFAAPVVALGWRIPPVDPTGAYAAVVFYSGAPFYARRGARCGTPAPT